MALALSGLAAFISWWQADQAFPVTTLVAIDQVCLNWAVHVDRLDRLGLDPKAIDRRGQWFSNVSATTDNIDSPFTITDLCGTAEGILEQRGKPPTEPGTS